MKRLISITLIFVCFTCSVFAKRIPEGYIVYPDGWRTKCDGLSEDGYFYTILYPEELLKDDFRIYYWDGSNYYSCLLSCKDIYEEKCIFILGMKYTGKHIKELKIPEKIDGYKVVGCKLYCFEKYEDNSDLPTNCSWDISYPDLCDKLIVPASVFLFQMDQYQKEGNIPSLLPSEICFLRNRNELMYVSMCEEKDYYLNDGKTFPLDQGKIHWLRITGYQDSIEVSKNWSGLFRSNNITFEEGIVEIDNITLEPAWTIADKTISFPKSLKKFNGEINIKLEEIMGSKAKYFINIPDGTNIKFEPGSIKLHDQGGHNIPVTIANCEECGLDRSFIDYLIKQNYPFDKE